MHELKAFGGLTLTDTSGAVAEMPRRRLALLAAVAAGGRRGISRERLAGLFWPDDAAESGRHSLDQLLSLVRRQLGDGAFTGGDPLRLNPAIISCDVATFEAAIAAGEPAAGVAEYAGPFLDGFYLSGAAEFERWVEGERARLAHLYCEALEQLARKDSARGDLAGAVVWWRRMVVSDPLGSKAALGLLRALVAAGDRPGAMQHARIYEALVRQQLEMPPDPSIAAFVEQLRNEPEARPVSLRPGSASTAPTGLPAQIPADGAGAETAPAQSLIKPGSKRRRLWPWIVAASGVASLIAWNIARRPAAADACTGRDQSVAVLPFVNIGGNQDDEYLSDGLTDELIAALQGIPGVHVAPRSSSFYFKGKGGQSRDIGRQLNVTCLVEGSLRREGNQIRVNASLIDVKSGFPLWSEVYDQQKTGVLALQAQVARSITDNVLRRVSHGPSQASRSHPTTADSAAYDLYLQGRYFLNRRSDLSLVRAIERFKAALARDSSFALAWSGLADCYALQTTWGGVAPGDAFPLAKQAAQRALALDSTRAEVHTSLGIISLFYDWNWPEAKAHFERALALDPDYAATHQFYAWYYESQNLPEDAVREIQQAALLEPLSVIITTRLGTILARRHGPAEAIAPLQRAIQLDSTDANPRFDLALVYSVLGRHDSALAYVPALGHLGNYEGGMQVFVLANAGRTAAARTALAVLEQLRRTRYVSGEAMAAAYAALGNRDRAFTELRRAVAERSFLLPFARTNLVFRSLQGDPRFREILAMVGVP